MTNLLQRPVLNIATFPENADHAAAPAGKAPPPAAIFRVQGPMSTFGGPHDLGMTPSEGLALFESEDVQAPDHRDLFLPSQPPGTSGLGRRLNPEKFYLACRWDYKVTSRSLLRDAVAVVQSVRTGRVEQARPADWGPNVKTGRVADLSPGLATALGLETDDHVLITIHGRGAASVPPVAASSKAPASDSEPKIYSTSDWGAAPARAAHFPERMAAGIVVHNTQGANREPLIGDAEWAAAQGMAKLIQHSHLCERGWADTGQHFTISRGGLVFEGRHGALAAARAGRVVEGAHAVSSDGSANRTWFGIELEGDNREADRVTLPQYAALVELCAWLIKWCGVQTLPIKGHLDVLAGHTDCPGKFEQRLPSLRRDVVAKRTQLG